MHALRKFVQDRMDARGWRPADLVTASGINKQVVSGLLTDDRDSIDRMPSEKTIAGLCRAFSVDRDTVLAVVGEAMGLPVARPVVVYDASHVPNDELIRELAKRLGEAGGEHVQRSAPTSTAGHRPASDRDIESGEGASVSEPGQVYTLDGRRRRAAERSSEGPATVPEQRAVANEDETIATEGEAHEEQP